MEGNIYGLLVWLFNYLLLCCKNRVELTQRLICRVCGGGDALPRGNSQQGGTAVRGPGSTESLTEGSGEKKKSSSVTCRPEGARLLEHQCRIKEKARPF